MIAKRREGLYAVVCYNKLQVKDEIIQYDREKKELQKIEDVKKPESKKRKRNQWASSDSPTQKKKIGKDEHKTSNSSKGQHKPIITTQNN